jgi:hypothetical protein
MTTNAGIMLPTHGEVHSIQPDEIKTTFCQKSCEDRWFSPVSPHNKADRYNITEILLKVVLSTQTIPLKIN